MKIQRLVIFVGFAIAAAALAAQGPVQEVTVDAKAAAHSFPHFWEDTFGSGRAILALRDNYRKDLVDVHDQAGHALCAFSRDSAR